MFPSRLTICFIYTICGDFSAQTPAYDQLLPVAKGQFRAHERIF